MMQESLDLDLHPTFDVDMFDIDEKRHADETRRAVAIKTRSRINARRAKSEAILADILPATIDDGDAWHVLSSGDVDSLSYLAHLLAAQPMDYVALSTWCMAMDDVQRLDAWLKDGTIGRLDAYVGEIFPNQYAAEHDALCKAVAAVGGRVCVFRNHSKVYLCRAGARCWVIESSANINTNPRTENTVITASVELYRHHLGYYSAVRSFNRDFDKWTQPED